MLKKTTVSLSLILFVALIAVAADKITGTWIGKFVTDNDESASTYILKAEGETLTGNVSSELGVLPIYDGKISGETVSFKVNVSGLIFQHTGKVNNDTLTLKLSVGENEMQGKFVRAKTK